MTLRNAAINHVRIIVWCKACKHQVEPDPAETAARYGAETSVLDWPIVTDAYDEFGRRRIALGGFA